MCRPHLVDLIFSISPGQPHLVDTTWSTSSHRPHLVVDLKPIVLTSSTKTPIHSSPTRPSIDTPRLDTEYGIFADIPSGAHWAALVQTLLGESVLRGSMSTLSRSCRVGAHIMLQRSMEGMAMSRRQQPLSALALAAVPGRYYLINRSRQRLAMVGGDCSVLCLSIGSRVPSYSRLCSLHQRCFLSISRSTAPC